MLHIHGSWGSGKSSLLNFMRQELEQLTDSEPWVCIYFNAWRYQRLGPPWWALTRELYRQARRKLRESDAAEDRRRADVLLANELWWRLAHGWGGIVLMLGLAVVGLAMLAGVDDVESDVETWAEMAGHIGALIAVAGGVISGLRFVLTGSARGSDAVLEIVGDPLKPLVQRYDAIVRYIGRPVVIFIDDLDRCDGDYIIRLLHGIQTMYWGTQMAYVVAADRDWLRAAYQNHYEPFAEFVSEPGRPIGYLFLEKLFQLSTGIPGLSTAAMSSFWQRILGISDRNLDQLMSESRDRARSEMQSLDTESGILEATRTAADDVLLQQARREEAVVRLASKEVEQSTEHALIPYLPLLEPNPRAMKRMVNAYGVRRTIDVLRGGHTDRSQLALWTIVEMRWPILAEHLARFPGDLRMIESGHISADRGLDPQIQSLLLSAEVRRVVRAEAPGLESPLTETGIAECVGFAALPSETLTV